MTTITALPPAPDRGDPVNFADKADAWVAALPTFGTEANAVAGEINTAASTASTAATTATTQAGIATTQAGIATTKASEALASANAAAASYDLFDDRWLGAKTSDPALDNDGNPLTVGVAYFNSTTNLIRIYNGTGWQDALGSVTGQFTILREVKTATAGQTVFNLTNNYTVGINALMLYVNGVRLLNADYTETNATTVTLATGLAVGDELLVEIGVTNTGTTTSAGLITSNPVGTIAATNVQAAIQELDADRVAVSALLPAGTVVGTTDTQTLTNKSLTSPIINTPVITRNVQVIGTNTTAVPSGTYVLTASLTLTLPATPTAGQWVEIINRSATTTCIVGRNATNIMGLAEDLTINSLTASFTLTYADATRGWVFND